ncbi:MAG TPA: DUF6683 family protein [Kofleriaceae bacterium]
MRFILLVSILLSLVTGTARADMVWHDAYKSPLSDWGAYQYYRNVKQPMAERDARNKAAGPKVQPVVAHAPMSASDFRRGPRTNVVTRYVATLPLAAADAAQLTAALDTTMAQLQKAGRKNNVATAMATTITLAHMVLDRDDVDASKVDTLVVSLNDVLANAPQFKQLTSQERQQMADELLLSSALIAILHQAGAIDASKAFAEQVLITMTGSAR